MKVSWDDYSRYMEKIENVPNDQPGFVTFGGDVGTCHAVVPRFAHASEKALSTAEGAQMFCLAISRRKTNCR